MKKKKMGQTEKNAFAGQVGGESRTRTLYFNPTARTWGADQPVAYARERRELIETRWIIVESVLFGGRPDVKP